MKRAGGILATAAGFVLVAVLMNLVFWNWLLQCGMPGGVCLFIGP